MKKLLFILLFFMGTNAYALNICTASVPKDCNKILDSEFSTGGGSTTMWLLEVGCHNTEGNYIKYVGSYFAPTGLFGSFVGRMNTPDKILFHKEDVEKMTFECD